MPWNREQIFLTTFPCDCPTDCSLCHLCDNWTDISLIVSSMQQHIRIEYVAVDCFPSPQWSVLYAECLLGGTGVLLWSNSRWMSSWCLVSVRRCVQLLLLSPSVQGPDSHRPPHDVEMRHLHFIFIVCKPRMIAWSGYRFRGKQIWIWLSWIPYFAILAV